MNREIEQQFVKKYIDASCQERLLYELGTPKKRSNALSRFSHNVEAVLKKSVNKTFLTDVDDLREEDQTVYLISWDEKDGRRMPLCEALRYFKASYMSVVLIGKDFSLIKEETEKGSVKILRLE